MNGPATPAIVVRRTGVRHLVLAALLVIAAINYAQRNCISPLATTIEASIGVTPQQLDLAAGAFFLSYTLFQVPASWLAQRWGPRLTLALYAAGWSLALVGCALAADFAQLYAGRLVMGALQAGVFSCATLVLAVWYPPSQRGLATALLSSSMLVGGAGGTVLAGLLLHPLSWRGVFLLYAAPGVLWAGWFVWWFRNHPREHSGVNRAEVELLTATAAPAAAPTSRSTGRAAAWLVFLSLPFVLLCAQQTFRAAHLRLFDSRLPTYFERQRGVNVEKAALLASIPQWVAVVGSVVGGAISDHVLRRTGSRRWARKGVAIFSLASSALVYLAAYFMEDVTMTAVVLGAGAFLFSFSSPCAFALLMDMGGRHLAVAFGLLNMFANLGSFAFVSSVMTVVEWGGWDLALGVWLGLHLMALVCWVFLDADRNLGQSSS